MSQFENSQVLRLSTTLGHDLTMLGDTVLLLLKLHLERFVKLEGARARTGLCVDVSSGVMI